jgi:hypothetical protein
MEDTYTFVARSTNNPAHMAVFTLHDHSMSVTAGEPLAQLEKALYQPVEGEEVDVNSRELRERAPALAKPILVRLLQRIAGPFELADVDVRASDEGLHVVSWYRVGGLRVAPMVLIWDQVDNSDAAQKFAQEIDKRQKDIDESGRFPGPLDYWAGWLLTAVTGLLALGIGRRRLRMRGES